MSLAIMTPGYCWLMSVTIKIPGQPKSVFLNVNISDFKVAKQKDTKIRERHKFVVLTIKMPD